MSKSCENCTHYPVCENKNYNIVKPCGFYMEEKKGEWIYHKDWHLGGESPWECSECGAYYGDDMNFCGECGADMREADNDKTN